MKSDNLEQLKSRLYKKGESFKDRKRRVRIYGEKEKVASSSWGETSGKERKKVFKPLKIAFVASAIFFLASLAALAYFWVGGNNIVSAGNIDMEIKGPAYVKGGEIADIDIFITNKNSAELKFADLVIDFPEGVFSSDGGELSREKYSFGIIAPGASIKKSLSFVLLGEENQEKEIKMTLEYRLAESNAIFAKKGKYIIRISRPPVGVSLEIPKEANSKQEIEIKVGLVSNSDAVINNLALWIEYPSGFQFSNAVPSPSRKDSIWKIGDFNPSQEREILIKGIMEGQDLEEKAFRAQVGIIKDSGDFLPYGVSVETIVVKKPYIDLVLFVGGKDKEDNIAFSGDSLRMEMVWKNNMTVPVRNAIIEMKIIGNAVNQKTISVSKGFYRTFDKTLVWNSSSMPELAAIEPGETGRAQFSFSILNPLPIKGAGDKSFAIKLKGKLDGNAVSETTGSGAIRNEATKEIKIGSELQFASMALRYSGPFENSGPMPPKVGEETEYTITWSLGGVSNDFSGAKAKASFPSYMRWIDNVSPADENVVFDKETGEIVWDIGMISAGTGIISPAREVSFQVAFDPNLSQVGIAPNLIMGVEIEARDDFTGEIFKDKKRSLTTILSNDPKFDQLQGRVVE